MFHSCLSEEKIDMFLILQSVHKIRSWKMTQNCQNKVNKINGKKTYNWAVWSHTVQCGDCPWWSRNPRLKSRPQFPNKVHHLKCKKKWFQGVHKGSKVTIEVGFLYMQSTHSTKSWKFCWISKGGKERTLASEGSEKKMLLLSKIVHNLWQGIYGKNMVRNVKDFRPHGERSWVPLALYEKWFRWKLITNLEKNSVWPIQGQNSVWWTSLK